MKINMRHLEVCCYLHILLVNLKGKNKITYKASVESSLQMGEGKENDEDSRAPTSRVRIGGFWGLIHYLL